MAAICFRNSYVDILKNETQSLRKVAQKENQPRCHATAHDIFSRPEVKQDFSPEEVDVHHNTIIDLIKYDAIRERNADTTLMLME